MKLGMRHLWPVVVLTAAFTAALTPSMANAAQDQPAIVKTGANLRTEPNTTSGITTAMPKGTGVEVVCWARGEPTFGADKFGSMWLYVTRNDGGWVHSSLVTPVSVPPCSTGGEIAFANCEVVPHAMGVPFYRDSVAYGLHLDRDRNGWACEEGE
jgi:hypothetical protein